MAAITPSSKRPSQILNDTGIDSNLVHSQFLVSVDQEIRSEKLNFGLTLVSRESFYRTIRKVSLLALSAIYITGIVLSAIYAHALFFPVAIGGALIFLKAVPLIHDPLKNREIESAFKLSKLFKIKEIENQLRSMSCDQLNARYLEPLNIARPLTIADSNVLSESDTYSFYIPILARFEFWKSEIAHTRNKISLIEQKREELTTLLHHDDLATSAISQAPPLESSEREKIENEHMKLKHQAYQLMEIDDPYSSTSGQLLSAIRAAYLLHIMKNPNNRDSLSDYGTLIFRSESDRLLLTPLQSAQSYFQKKRTGEFIEKEFFIQHASDQFQHIEELRQRVFSN